MSQHITRRQFLKAAGGVTFLALVPIGRGLFAAPLGTAPKALPVFTALPYIQPGDNSKLVDGRETIVIAWQTQNVPADFVVEYGPTKAYGNRATIEKTLLVASGADDGENRFNYAARPANLKLATKYFYRVTCDGAPILEGFFNTRQPRGQKIRFVAFGDNSYGDISDRAIAYQAYQAHPDFVMNTGDNVYDAGLDNEYARYFFPVYNADLAGPRIGAPLLRSVPFYSVIANHDVRFRDANKFPVADFDKAPDCLGYYTALHLPLNGPTPAQPTPIVGAADQLDKFRACAGDRFPRMANYSFDYGDAHFVCLDANIYVDPSSPAMQAWIDADLAATDATWKFAVFHHPAFNVGEEHYLEQHMRILAPLFEKHNLDFALHGHEHIYQRNKPLRFAPKDTSRVSAINSSKRQTPGAFTIDEKFDGVKNTRPDGVIYITTGAGGKHLYDADLNQNPAKWVHPEDDNAPYVANLFSDRHSLTVFDLDSKTAVLRQVDQWGQEIDRITVTKA